MFATISFIEAASGNVALTGIATYKSDEDEFISYNYKAFNFANNNNQHMINRIERNKIMLIIGKFTLENSELDVNIYLFFQQLLFNLT